MFLSKEYKIRFSLRKIVARTNITLTFDLSMCHIPVKICMVDFGGVAVVVLATGGKQSRLQVSLIRNEVP